MISQTFSDLSISEAEIQSLKTEFNSLQSKLSNINLQQFPAEINAIKQKSNQIANQVASKERPLTEKIEKVKSVLAQHETTFYNALSQNINEIFVFEYNWLKNLQYDFNKLANENAAEKTFPSYSPTILRSFPFPQAEFFISLKGALGQQSQPPIEQRQVLVGDEQILFKLLENREIHYIEKAKIEKSVKNEAENNWTLIEFLEKGMKGKNMQLVLSPENFSFFSEKIIIPAINLVYSNGNFQMLFRIIYMFQFATTIEDSGKHFTGKNRLESEELLKDPQLWAEAFKILFYQQNLSEKLVLINFASASRFLNKNQLQNLLLKTAPFFTSIAPQEVLAKVETIDKEPLRLIFYFEKLEVDVRKQNFSIFE